MRVPPYLVFFFLLGGVGLRDRPFLLNSNAKLCAPNDTDMNNIMSLYLKLEGGGEGV